MLAAVLKADMAAAKAEQPEMVTHDLLQHSPPAHSSLDGVVTSQVAEAPADVALLSCSSSVDIDKDFPDDPL